MLVQSWQIWLQQWLTQLEQRMARAELGAHANAKPPFVNRLDRQTVTDE